MKNETLTVNDPSFSPEFHQFLATADLDDIYQEYSDAYKELWNIRPRWTYEYSRDEFARAFISLGKEWVAYDNNLREEAEYEASAFNQMVNGDWIPADKYEALAGEPL